MLPGERVPHIKQKAEIRKIGVGRGGHFVKETVKERSRKESIGPV